jgi:branched-chain amino acid transport system substrate-binding protein
MVPFRRTSGLLLLVLLATSCNRSQPAAVIGLAYAPTSRYVEAARLAAIDLDEPGKATPIRLYLDSSLVTDSAQVHVRRAERLVAMPDLMTVIGPGTSRGALAAAPIYTAAGVAQLNPEATSHLLDRVDARIFTMIPNDSEEGQFIARFVAEKLKARTVSIFFDNDEYGIGLREGVERALAARHIAVVDKVPFGLDGAYDVLVRASFQRVRPDAVVIVGRSGPTGQLVRVVHELAPGMEMVAGDAAMIPTSLAPAGDSALAHLHIVSFWFPTLGDTAATAFARRFRAMTGRDAEPTDAYVYDGIMLSAAAIRAAGRDRDAVWDWLRSLGGANPPYVGVTGSISYGRPATHHMVMAQFRHGAMVPVWQVP